MKILTMYQTNRDGGVFKRLIYLIEALLESGNEVHYISTGKFPIDYKNLRFHKVNEFKGIKVLSFFKFMPQGIIKSFRLLREENFDRVIVFGSLYGFMGWILKKFYDFSLIMFIRGDLLENTRILGRTRYLKLVYFAEKKAFEASDKVVVNAKTLREKIVRRYGVPQEKIHLIYNNIPPGFEKRGRKILDGEYIGFAGIVEKRKGIDLLIDAYARVYGQLNKKLVVVGRGPMENGIKKKVRDYGIENRVEFLGWREDMLDVLSSIELLVVPSLSEGCPNVVLEALGCRTPCIGSGVDGIEEVLKYDELLFKPNDSKAIEEKLLKVFRNYEKVKKLCSERRKEFLFDWKKECIKLIVDDKGV